MHVSCKPVKYSTIFLPLWFVSALALSHLKHFKSMIYLLGFCFRRKPMIFTRNSSCVSLHCSMELFVKKDLQCLVLFLLTIASVWREPRLEKRNWKSNQDLCCDHKGIWNRSDSTQKGHTTLDDTVLSLVPGVELLYIWFMNVFVCLFIIVPERDQMTRFQGNTRADESLSLSETLGLFLFLFLFYVSLFGKLGSNSFLL